MNGGSGRTTTVPIELLQWATGGLLAVVAGLLGLVCSHIYAEVTTIREVAQDLRVELVETRGEVKELRSVLEGVKAQVDLRRIK